MSLKIELSKKKQIRVSKLVRDLLNEFYSMSLESFLADETAEMVGFTLVSDFEFSCILV
jgi:hypothetical protein